MNPLDHLPNDPGSIRPQSRPPADPRPVLPIAKAPSFGTAVFHILSPDLHGYFLHYVEKKTIPCTNDEPLTCWLCHNGIGKRWTGFLACLDLGGNPFIVQVTDTAVEYCPRFEEFAGDLRGRRISLARLKQHKTGPVKVMIEKTKSNILLREEPDVHAALCRLWRVQSLRRAQGRR